MNKMPKGFVLESLHKHAGPEGGARERATVPRPKVAEFTRLWLFVLDDCKREKKENTNKQNKNDTIWHAVAAVLAS